MLQNALFFLRKNPLKVALCNLQTFIYTINFAIGVKILHLIILFLFNKSDNN